LIQYIIEIHRLPSRALNPNRHAHWVKWNKAMIADKDAVIASFKEKYYTPARLLTSVKIEVYFILDGYHYDWDNLCGMTKGFLDGLVKFVIFDDNIDIVKELVLGGRRKTKKETSKTFVTVSEV
jgi:hypothetical protein